MTKLYIALKNFTRTQYFTDNSSKQVEIQQNEFFIEESYNGFRYSYNYETLTSNKSFTCLGYLKENVDYKLLTEKYQSSENPNIYLNESQ